MIKILVFSILFSVSSLGYTETVNDDYLNYFKTNIKILMKQSVYPSDLLNIEHNIEIDGLKIHVDGDISDEMMIQKNSRFLTFYIGRIDHPNGLYTKVVVLNDYFVDLNVTEAFHSLHAYIVSEKS